MKLYNVIKQLIFEASADDISNSIRNRNIVTIYYDGDDDGKYTGKGLRVIEPFCYGKSKKGNMVIRAWEREGASYTGSKGEQPLPGWRLFRVDKILSFKPTGETFNDPKPGFNPNGDKGMVRILSLVSFDNPEQNIA
jgi:predicted DNA-binding transcriptional regulator YafY